MSRSPEGKIVESNEANNARAFPVTLARPDLVLDSATIDGPITRDPYYGRCIIRVRYTVTNRGTIAAQPAWFDLAYISSGSTLDNTAENLDSYVYNGAPLLPMASYTQTTTYYSRSLLPAGTYTLFIKTDGRGNASSFTSGTNTDNGFVPEANETNNVRSITVVLP